MSPILPTIVSILIGASLVSGSAHAALQGRDLDGNASTFEAYYDTALNITWLANANAGAGSAYDDVGALNDTTTDGKMSWVNATAWAGNLSIADAINNITYDNWRLPTVIDTGLPGCDYAYSGTDCGYNVDTATGEMAHLFYQELGNKAAFGETGLSYPYFGLGNTEPFINLQAEKYWAGVEYVIGSGEAGYFNFYTGGQLYGSVDYGMYALAISPGDVAAVPETDTWIMLLAGLGLVSVATKGLRGRGI